MIIQQRQHQNVELIMFGVCFDEDDRLEGQMTDDL